MCCLFLLPTQANNRPIGETAKPSFVEVFQQYSTKLYQSINEPALDLKLFQFALKGYYQLQKQGKLTNASVLSIIDFRKPSNEKRYFLIDMDNGTLIRKSLVAHGRNSGDVFAKSFSNNPNSHKSSLGFYLVGETYQGEHGLSVRLDGMENSFNNEARDRAVVIHSAPYVSQQFIQANQHLGRSFGCPALPEDGFANVVDKIKDGSCLFIYYPDQKYLSGSKYLNAPNFFEYFTKQVAGVI